MIHAAHYVRDPYSPGFTLAETRMFGSLRAARLWAESILPPTVTTNDCYWRDTARAPHVDLTRVYRGKRPSNKGRFWRKSYAPAGRCDASVIIVPSVGELGYW